MAETFHLHLSEGNHDNDFYCANIRHYPCWYGVCDSLWLSCNNLFFCTFLPIQLFSSHNCSLSYYADPNYQSSIKPLEQLPTLGAQSMMSHLHLAAQPLFATCFLERIWRIEGGRVEALGIGMTYLYVPASGSLGLEGGLQTILVWALRGHQGLSWPWEWRS